MNETLKPTTQYAVATKPPLVGRNQAAILPAPTEKETQMLFPEMAEADPMFPTQPPVDDEPKEEELQKEQSTEQPVQ